MSLPPALLQRLAQRGLVNKQKQKAKETDSLANVASSAENEEVIAEDYDEMEAEEPSQYEHASEIVVKKRTEENFWLERIKARMGEVGSTAGYKGCPNKYNIWHKCSLFCVNRWADGQTEPSRDYMRRYKRLLRKYPLPKGWLEMYDPGCGSFYFYNTADSMVSWLPPTHPKSQISKSAAAYRRQLEESSGDATGAGSDGEQQPDDEDDDESAETRHHREIDDIINSSLRPRSPTPSVPQQVFASLQESVQPRKQKPRDLERTLSRQRRSYGHAGSRRHAHNDADKVDPMDPSSYSDTPRGKWSDGLHASEERKKSSAASTDEAARERAGSSAPRERRQEFSDDDDDRDYA